jgi:hypothetical protein
MRTENLQGAALDWAVAKCEGKNGVLHDDGITRCIVVAAPSGVYKGTYRPSTNWAQGGPIIEREELTLSCHWQRPYAIKVLADEKRVVQGNGPTPLIAAMRCYVAAHLGDEVEVPEELK